MLKDNGKQKSRKNHKIRKIKCPKCGEFNLDEQIELGNVDKIAGIKITFCPICGMDIQY